MILILQEILFIKLDFQNSWHPKHQIEMILELLQHKLSLELQIVKKVWMIQCLSSHSTIAIEVSIAIEI